MANDQKAEELDIYNKWKQTGDKRHFQALYASMKPLIYSAAKKASYGSNLPESAHRAYAAQNFLDALRTFDPTKGGALQTHVYGAVHQKAKRLGYTYGNLGHIPEPRAKDVGLFQTEHSNLREGLGRIPTTEELAKQLGWSNKDVMNIQREIHRDLALAEGVEEQATFETSVDEETLDMLRHELMPDEQTVYDHILGKNGRQRAVKANNKIDFDRISRATGFSTSKVRSLHGKIRDKLSHWVKK